MSDSHEADVHGPRRRPASDNADWYFANLDRLIDEYKGQYLAIHDQRVVAASYSSAELGERVRELGLTRVLFASSHPNAMGPRPLEILAITHGHSIRQEEEP